MGRRDDEAFVEFAEASRSRLRRTAYLMCGDWERASDIVQEALIRVYVAWPRLERSGGLAAYARRTVVNVAIDMSRRRSSSELPGPVPDGEGSGRDLAGSVSDRQALLGAMARLPQRQRACVVLRYFEDLPVGEVAALLGCSEGTVKSQTSRALTSLRSMFEAEVDDELVVSGEAGQAW
ncbi:MAG TPA: SigE family RNA polymerase sigma factor [Nocardioidaceae bacterium]|nr:SigE family RNA polymerase sigma factor [Nocardioidaceae bacterium]